MRRALLPGLLLLVACNREAPAEAALRLSVPAQQKMKEDFEKDNPSWKFAAGKWERRSGVLAQTVETQPWAVAILEDRKFVDVDVSVKFRPVSGKEDASGGILFRARDGKNYYVVRANALEDNFRLYAYERGRRQLASAGVKAPALGQWHTIRVVAVGDRIQAWLNGALHLDARDARFTSGRVGLWTKADSITAFDDLVIRG